MEETLACRASRPVLLLLLLLLLCLGGCRGGSPRPNVLLVTIDTLRADRVSSYGYARQTTPTLDALAAQGVRFEAAYSSSSWTAPSVASLLTSLQPGSHGVEHGHVATADAVGAESVLQQETLGDAVALWPELLAPAGYRSFGITANGHLDGRFGFARGFERYRCLGFVGLEQVEALLASWRSEIVGASPWFVWIHLFDPHAPYTPRPAWIRRYRPAFRGAGALGRVRLESQYRAMGVARGTPAFELVNLLYESEIAWTDAAIGRFLAALSVDADDLVVVTSDHGESFLEHDRFGHGHNLYEEVTRVPLILRLPGRAHAGRVVETPVAAIDLLPTVLDLLGLPVPAALQGVSLLPLIRDAGAPPHDVVTSLSRFAPLAQRALRRDHWKYVQRYADDEHELFDLETDPGEQRNLYGAQPERARALAAALEREVARERDARVSPRLEPLTAEEVEGLRELGYATDE